MYICFVRASSPYDCRVVCSIFLNHIQFVRPRPAATTAAADFRGKYPKMLYLFAACKRAFSPDPCFGQPWRPGFHLWTIIDVRVPRQAASRREWNNAKLETNCFRAAFYAYFLFMLQYHLAQLVVRLVWIFSHANVHQNVCLEGGGGYERIRSCVLHAFGCYMSKRAKCGVLAVVDVYRKPLDAW